MRYSSDYKNDVNQADELMISNVLNALNNNAILQLLSQEEYKLLLQTVKKHVVLKAGMALEMQNRIMSGTYGTSLNDSGRARM